MVEFLRKYGDKIDIGQEYDMFLTLLGLKKKKSLEETTNIDCPNAEDK